LRAWLWVSPWNNHLIKDDKVQPREFNDINKTTWNWTILHGMKTLLKVESCGLRATQLPEKDKWKFDVLSEKACRRKLAQTKNVRRKIVGRQSDDNGQKRIKKSDQKIYRVGYYQSYEFSVVNTRYKSHALLITFWVIFALMNYLFRQSNL
jgi:hypothetical protein